MKGQLLLLMLTASCLASQISFHNYKVYRVIPQTIKQLEVFEELQKNSYEYNFWTDTTKIGQSVDIMVPPWLNDKFINFTMSEMLQSRVWIEDVQKLINEQKSYPIQRNQTFGWTKYHTLDEIHDWLRLLASQHPETVKLIEGGRSYEGKTILGVHVSFKTGNKGAFLEGGVHAREWIAPATVTYILNELLTSTDSKVRNIAESWDWYVFPSVNPDGYVYTHTTDRMWRKTRQPYGPCYGADPNRNWNYHWMDGGSNNNPCSDTYAGPEPFSEIEIKTFSDYISSIATNLEAYITFHSYSQMLLIPYGHAGHEYAKDFEKLNKIGKNAAEKLSSCYGTQYQVGNVYDVIYVSSGRSPDWVMGTHGVPYVYSYELRDTGNYGFLLPPEQIIPTGEETFVSLISIFDQIGSQ